MPQITFDSNLSCVYGWGMVVGEIERVADDTLATRNLYNFCSLSEGTEDGTTLILKI